MFYTGKGDDGSSSTFNNNTRCNKNEPIFHALGNVDELGALLGVCFAKAKTKSSKVGELVAISEIIRNLQEDLFVVQAELAGSNKRITKEQVVQLEAVIADLSLRVENPKAFVIAGSTELSALLDLSRTVARRAERSLLGLGSASIPSQALLAYMNRLSSVLYVLARFSATYDGQDEQNPSY